MPLMQRFGPHPGAPRGQGSFLLACLVLAAAPCLAAFNPPLEQRIWPPDRIAGDQFGISVAVDASMDGPYLVVGAFRSDQVAPSAGKVHVFRQEPGILWQQVEELFAPDGDASDLFGRAVAIDGNTLVVGAPDARKDANNPTAGAVYIFERESDGPGWTFEQKLTASDGVNGDDFGWALAIDSDKIVVGALEKDAGLGAAYVFAQNEFGVWNEQAKLEDPDGEAGDFLGVSVDIDGDAAVVGSYKDTVETSVGPREKGSVVVFTRGGGVWSFDQKVFSAGSAQFIDYGQSVALDDGVLAVGAPGDTPPFLPGQTIRVTGTVYRYDATAADIKSTQVRVYPSDKGIVYGPRQFGHALALEGNVLAIGAYGDGSNGTDSGALYLFDLQDNLLNESLKLTAFDGSENDVFGFSVAVSGDLIAVGADRADVDDGADDNAGAAYTVDLPEPGAALLAATALTVLGSLRPRARPRFRLGRRQCICGGPLARWLFRSAGN
jgi:hypothetical protein